MWLRDVIAEIRPVKPIYDQLTFIDFYSSKQLSGHFVTSIQDKSNKYPTDLYVQVGEFALDNDSYLWIVNRHSLPGDQLDLAVTLNLPIGNVYGIDEIDTGQRLANLTNTSSTFDMVLGPGKGRLINVYYTSKEGDLNTDECIDRTDLQLLLKVIRGLTPPDPLVFYDLNSDEVINIADARRLVTLFTNLRGTPCTPGP
jgi:hypothetical protein